MTGRRIKPSLENAAKKPSISVAPSIAPPIGPSLDQSTIEPATSAPPKLSYDEHLMEFATLRSAPADELERFYKTEALTKALDTRTYAAQEMIREGRINPSDLILESALLQKSLADTFAQAAYKAAHSTGINETVLNTANNSSQLARTSTFQLMAYSHEKRLEEGASKKPSYFAAGMIPKSVRERRTQIKTVHEIEVKVEDHAEDRLQGNIKDFAPDINLDISQREPALARKRP